MSQHLETAVLDLPLPARRLARAKCAYTTRFVQRAAMAGLLAGDLRPEAGDVVLVRVERLGQHLCLELPSGRRATLHQGDELVVCYAARYAPDQFEADVPEDLGPCELVAAGGVAARVRSRHAGMRPATALSAVGLVADEHRRRLNLRDWGLRPGRLPASRPPVVAVVGTAMNAGKTTAAGHLVRGLVSAGLRVGSAKITGTGSGPDTWFLADAGATPALDFTAAGHASTCHLELDEVVAILERLTASAGMGNDAVVLEIADGVLQEETAALLASAPFARTVDGVLFAAGDAPGAAGGRDRLQALGLPLLAVTGALTASPLALREAQAVVDVPVLDRAELADPSIACSVLARAGRRALVAA